MNILSSTIWPSDMPDDRRVIALLGLVQISEEGMESKSVLKRLCVQDPVGMAEKMHAKDKDIERLNVLVAMQAEALRAVSAADIRWLHDFHVEGMVDKALSATSETVSAWQSARDNEIVSRAFELAADNASDDASEKYCRFLAERLRAKGE